MAIKRHTKWRRRLKRWLKRRNTPVLMAACIAVVIGGYMAYSSDKRHRVDPQSYQPLLQVIAQAESKGNYNAYFGHAHNSTVRFTDMTIQQVLDWQADYIAQGSPSSAVGRYQFLNTTLEGLVDEQGIDRQSVFSESLQDQLAMQLLERRGAEKYVNQELSKHAFAANLAKEWASLPMVVGAHPNKSYYEADGLNKALVAPSEVLGAVDAMRAE